MGKGGWPVEVLWLTLCPSSSWSTMQDCWAAPRLKNQRTCRALEDTQISFMKLLVDKYVLIYWPVLQDVRHVPSHESPEMQTVQQTTPPHHSWGTMGCGECRLHHQTPQFTWLQCNHVCGRLSEQVKPFHTHSHNSHSVGLSPTLPPEWVETAWATSINAVWQGAAVCGQIYAWIVLSSRDHTLCICGLSPTDQWPDQVH